MSKSTIRVTAYLPDELICEFVQHLRDFDSKHHNEIHMQIAAVTGLGQGQLEQIIDKIRPGFELRWSGPRRAG